MDTTNNTINNKKNIIKKVITGTQSHLSRLDEYIHNNKLNIRIPKNSLNDQLLANSKYYLKLIDFNKLLSNISYKQIVLLTLKCLNLLGLDIKLVFNTDDNNISSIELIALDKFNESENRNKLLKNLSILKKNLIEKETQLDTSLLEQKFQVNN